MTLRIINVLGYGCETELGRRESSEHWPNVEISLLKPSGRLLVGDGVVLICVSNVSINSVAWIQNGKFVPERKNHVSRRASPTFQVLEIQTTVQADSGSYACEINSTYRSLEVKLEFDSQASVRSTQA